MIRIRAFRAIDDNVACNQYAQEHLEVLKIFGITKITTANTSWIFNPNVYVISAERTEDNIMVGGARIHLYHQDYPLPMEIAIKDFDKNIYSLLQEHALKGTGEICGLWNARSVAGFGIGTTYLSRVGMAIASQLPLHSMFVLCGEHTIGITLEKGYSIEERLGNKGTFYYPKEGLVATAAVINDVNNLSNARDEDRENILSLRKQPDQTRIENNGKVSLQIEYKLDLKL